MLHIYTRIRLSNCKLRRLLDRRAQRDRRCFRCHRNLLAMPSLRIFLHRFPCAFSFSCCAKSEISAIVCPSALFGGETRLSSGRFRNSVQEIYVSGSVYVCSALAQLYIHRNCRLWDARNTVGLDWFGCQSVAWRAETPRMDNMIEVVSLIIKALMASYLSGQQLSPVPVPTRG